MKVQLIKAHTHAGIGYQPDDVIDVPQHDARWLAAHEIVQQGNRQPRRLRVVPPDPTDEDAQA